MCIQQEGKERGEGHLTDHVSFVVQYMICETIVDMVKWLEEILSWYFSVIELSCCVSQMIYLPA